ncbi:hypothetical protein BC829DRAFT_105084 [Chytridium lagenaria]|nr:hypothetical protein BC829DRAFT_105084 [Chytridium lagenaria]
MLKCISFIHGIPILATNYISQARSQNKDTTTYDYKPALGMSWAQFPSKTLLLSRPSELADSFVLTLEGGQQVQAKRVRAELYRSQMNIPVS